MSGPIRKLLGPAKARLKGYLEDAEKFLTSPINEGDLEEEEAIIEEYIERINNNTAILERCDREWSVFLSGVKDKAEKVTEEKEHSRVAEGTDGYIEVLMNAGEGVARFKGRLKRVKRKFEQKMSSQKMQMFNPSVASSAPFDQSNSHSILSSQGALNSSLSQDDIRVKVNLPKMQLPSFDGNIQQWTEFWEMFCTAVDQQNLSKVSKFTYLKGILKGAAATAISGIAITPDNYDLAVTILKERFGRTDVIIESLYVKLQGLPRCVNKFIEVKKTFEQIDKLLRQLDVQGEVVNNQMMLIQLVLSKFPFEVILKLEESKLPTERWTMENLRKEILKYIRVQENVYRYAHNSKGQIQAVQGDSNKPTCNTINQRSVYYPTNDTMGYQVQADPTEVFASLSGKGSGPRIIRPCIFCEGQHYNDQCRKYATLATRKRKLNKEKRCFICLKTGHVLKSCPHLYKRCCEYCGKRGYHNRCLCPEKFTGDDPNTESFCAPSFSNVTCVGDAALTVAGNVTRSGDITKRADTNLTYPCNVPLQPQNNNVPLQSGNVPLQQYVNTTQSNGQLQAHPTQSYLIAGEQVLLQTAIVPVRSTDGKNLINARVLLDSASQRTFMTTKLAQQLNLSCEYKEHLSVATFGAEKTRSVDTYVVHCQVQSKDGSYLSLSANVLKQITTCIQRNPLSQEDLEFLRLIPSNQLADKFPIEAELATVDILIGSDYFWSIIDNHRLVLPSGMFVLSSKFGYIVTGKYNSDCSTEESSVYHALIVSTGVKPVSCCVTDTRGVNKPSLKNLWSLEAIGIKDPLTANSDDEVLHKFCDSVRFENERYHVAWPWRQENFYLPDNYTLALQRLKSLVSRIRLDPELLRNYILVLHHQLEKGMIERVDVSIVTSTRKYYLPHHPVLTPSKTTTKVRIVYDGSAKGQSTLSSLNDCLYRGPVILPDLVGLLMRFRLQWIVVLADIEKAFLQIAIQRDERDVTRFLWLKDTSKLVVSDDNIEVYRFCRVPFGLTCSPFLLGATLKYHLQREGTPLALKIMSDIYVDNVLLGANSSEQAFEIYQEAKAIFRRASMNLREWYSNSDEFLKRLPADEISLTKDNYVKVFGLLWDKARDVINVSKVDKVSADSIVTKRSVLNFIAKIFDPLGLITPVTYHGKVFLQELWKMDKLLWDCPLPENLTKEWKSICDMFQNISGLDVPRFVGRKDGGTHQLLVFCDASLKCYATVVYLRTDDSTTVQTELIFSKMRLVPVGKGKSKQSKRLTIPRLELMAVLIGVRAANFVANELRINISQKILWTDSQCVLHWLRTTKPLSVFVENRVKEIRMSREFTFRYVASDQNPADLATRGLSVEELSHCLLWWHGPSWLQSNHLSWPVWNLPELTPEGLEEIKKSKLSADITIVAGDGKCNEEVFLFGMDKLCYSSLRKLLRVSVYILRFIKIMVWNKLKEETRRKHQQFYLLSTLFRELVDIGPITFREIKLTSLLWIYTLQHHHFWEVFVAIKQKKRHCLQMQLGLRLDEFEILRCHGRYAYADINEDAKHPKLLPRRSYFTKLLILEVHGRLIHSGVSLTLNHLRQEYWIPHGRVEVKYVLNQCVVCRHHHGAPFCLPDMPPWPKERVSASDPFKYIGLDYLGPVQVKEGNTVQKMWICLFTCLAVRAIHLELVKGLSAQLFLDCLRRFIARRGKPTTIISDNAPQFHLVKSGLDQQWRNVHQDEAVLSFFSYEAIEWRFTTALAPWKGGFYERLVGVVKRALRKGMGQRVLYWDKLMTLLSEVEAIVNTRPLTYIYEDFNSKFVLTPSHFLLGGYNNAIPFNTQDDVDDDDYVPSLNSPQSLLQYWKKNQKQLQLFWNEWSKGYLLSLRESLPLVHKGPRSQIRRQPELGEIVILRDNGLPRRAWKLAKVIELIQGKDNQIRSVKIQMCNKTILERAVNYLYPLEIKSVIVNEDKPANTSDSTCQPVNSGNSISENVKNLRTRKATIEARKKIINQLQDDPVSISFCFPRSVTN